MRIAYAIDRHVSRLEAQSVKRIEIAQFPDQPGRRLGKTGPDEIGRTIDGDDVGLADVHEAEDTITDIPIADIRPNFDDDADAARANLRIGHRIRIRLIAQYIKAILFIPTLPVPIAAVHHVHGRPMFAGGVFGLNPHFIGQQRTLVVLPPASLRGRR